MSTLGDIFTSELHATHLKPRGFKKTRHTFSRSHEGYTEHYQVQGSAWNNGSGPWTFYLNCGISFNGLPPRNPDRDFPRTHAWMRAQVFTAAPMPESVSAETIASDSAQVAEAIRQCSDYFQRRHLFLRDCYEHRRYHKGFLADPELGTYDKPQTA
jgi:hypothetical protein